VKPRNSIVDFYSGAEPDDQDRYLIEIQAWPDDALEASHDFIQWMFPLREPSGVNPGAPTLNDAVIAEFRSRPELMANLRRSFVRMLRFYGFELHEEPLRVALGPDFEESSSSWLRPWNHNYLRITRILKSTSLLGLEPEARAFFACLSDLFHAQKTQQAISMETFRFWQASVLRTRAAR
jgi:hypothetical protein